MQVLYKNKVLLSNVRYCRSIYARTRGLMFRKRQSAILATKKESRRSSAIHMYFVFFPLDIIWLDKNKTVIDIKQNIKPFTGPYIPKNPAQYVLEIPSQKKHKLSIGDVLNFQSKAI